MIGKDREREGKRKGNLKNRELDVASWIYKMVHTDLGVMM
jgi:hypothetical protein